jgi:hypothetical protein
MTLTKQQVREVLDVYIRAWEGQDPALIVTIFTEEASYHERVMGEPIRGRDGIRDYWQTKVVGTQPTSPASCSTSTWTTARRSPSGKRPLMTPPSRLASGCGRSRCSPSTAPD